MAKFADVLRARVEERQAEIDALKAEGDALADDETRSADEVSARVDEIIARAKELAELNRADLARADELDALEVERDEAPKGPTFLKRVPKPDAGDVRSMSTGQLVDGITKAIEERDMDPSHARRILKRHAGDVEWARGLFVRSSDVYQRGFVKLMSGRPELLSDEERAAMAVGTNTAGGHLLPTHLDPTIILTNTGSANVVRQIARVVTLTQGNTWNGITSAGISASWDAELAEVSDDTPNDFGKPSIPVYTGRAFAQVSYEALQDIDMLAQDIVMMLGDARDRLQSAAHCTGSGSGQPTGIFTALDANTNVEVVSTTAATIGPEDLQGIKRQVGVRFRSRGSYLMNPQWADAIKNLGTAVSASFSTDITQANTARLYNSPVYESDDAPAVITTTVRDNRVVFGDFSNYVIVDKPGSASLQYVPVLFNTANNLPDGRSGWLFQWREGADSVNDLAFRLLQDKTSE